MDYSSLNLEKMAESGICVKIKCPLTGKQLKASDGTDLFINVLGTDSKLWKAEIARIKRESAARETPPNEDEIKADKLKTEKEIDSIKKESNRAIQEDQKRFQAQQNAAAEAFQRKLNEERNRGAREFDALGAEVDRRVQLQGADPAQRKEL
jgi:hypothetical protein